MSQSTAISLPFRPISAGMGQAVAERTILRRKEDGEFEVKEISRKDYLKDRKAFLGLLEAKRREIELAKK